MKKYIIYYTILLAILAGKVVTTIYQGSMIVNHGSKIASLQLKKQQLSQQKSHLQTNLAQTNSLQAVMASAEISEYTPITQPISISATNAVAQYAY